MYLPRMQNNILSTSSSDPWFSRNEEIHKYINMSAVQSETEKFKRKCAERLADHSNIMATQLLKPSPLSKILNCRDLASSPKREVTLDDFSVALLIFLQLIAKNLQKENISRLKIYFCRLINKLRSPLDSPDWQ